MWNRQREAEEAREKLARAGEDNAAPNRNPPLAKDDIAVGEDISEPVARATAAE
jgi:ATP-binding cassette subfamily B protein